MDSAGKVVTIIFFDEEVFLYQRTVYESYTITLVYYQEVLQKMIAHFKKTPHKNVEEIFLHHDNAHPHVAYSVTVFLEKMRHPNCSTLSI